MSQPLTTVFVLVQPGEGAELVDRTLAGLAAEGGEGLTVHVVASDPGQQAESAERSETSAHSSPRSLGRMVNDLIAADGSEVLFFLTSGSVVHPEDLTASALLLRNGPATLVSGRTHDVVAPGVDVDRHRFWLELRAAGARNRLDVSESAGPVSLFGMSRGTYVALRGFDEAIHGPVAVLTDLEARARRAGVGVSRGPLVLRMARPLNSLEPAAGSAGNVADRTGLKPPIYRNLSRPIGNPDIDAPAVSIIISTFNRAAYLGDCLNSILSQSMPDFELILVDDGSTDDTEAVVSRFNDPRILYVKRENSGISAARNFGLTRARGTFVAVHDDDDIMLPWRLATQLAMLQPGDHGSFGISVHFDEVTGETHNLVHRLFTMQTALRYGNNPTHPTWLLRRDVMAAFGYDETLESGVDNNLALRMLRSGVRMAHCGVPLILRRLHTGQITRTAGETQKASAGMSRRMLQFANGGLPPSRRAGPRASGCPPLRSTIVSTACCPSCLTTSSAEP